MSYKAYMTYLHDDNEVVTPSPKGERWSHRPNKVEQRLMARALEDRRGVDRSVIFRECLIDGLRKYAKKKDLAEMAAPSKG